jgi:hypothetical protein
MKTILKAVIAISALGLASAGFACDKCSNSGLNNVGGKTVVFVADTVGAVGSGVGAATTAILAPTMETTGGLLWHSWYNCNWTCHDKCN